MTPSATPLLVTGLSALALGVAVLIREGASRVSQRFQLMTLMGALWLLCAAFMMAADDAVVALRWSRASYLGVALLPVTIFHFTATFLRLDRRLRMGLSLAWTTSLAFAVAFQASDLLLAGVKLHRWGHYTDLAGPSALFVTFFLALLGASLGLLWRSVRFARRPRERARIRALFLAFVVGLFGLVDFLPSFGLPLYPLGFLAVAGFLVLAARALWDQPLVEIDQGFAAGDVLATIPGAVVVTDAADEVRLANPAALRLLGFTLEELLGRGVAQIVASPLNVGWASHTLMRGESIRGRTMVWKRADGENVEVEVTASLIRDDLGVPSGTVYMAEDVRDRIRADRIEYQAFHDGLTGLPNRALFRERLEESLERFRSREDGATLALLYLDLDQFKLINDSLGHSVGDGLLQEAAARLRETLRQEDLVCRLGGDEFAALVEVRGPEAGAIVAQKVVDAMNRPFVVAGHELFSTASVGIAHHPRHGEDEESLLQSADSAMYEAKKEGGNAWKTSGEGAARRARHRLNLINELRGALERGELELRYQPIVDLEKGRVGGAEALLRWRTRDELRPPADFLKTAEDTGLITSIGLWVLREACARAVGWQTESAPRRVAVNLSARQLQDAALPRMVDAALSACGLRPELLELEITETAAMKAPPHITTILEELSEIGVRIAMDDFGTGYSSLSHLQRFPLHILKIDQMFTRGIGVGRPETAIVEATLAMARALDLEVTAEGVETHEQLKFLYEHGCPRVQGFAISEPLTEKRLLRFMERGSPLRTRLRRSWVDSVPFLGSAVRSPVA